MSKSSWALPKPSVGRRAQSAKRWLSLSEAASTSRRCYVSERDQADSSRCRCQYEFCYTCLARWRTCKCPLWDERRIVDRPIPANDAPQDAVNLANAVPPVPVAHPNLLPAQPTVRAAQPQPQVPAQPAVQPTSKHKDNGRRKRQRNKKKRITGATSISSSGIIVVTGTIRHVIAVALWTDGPTAARVVA